MPRHFPIKSWSSSDQSTILTYRALSFTALPPELLCALHIGASGAERKCAAYVRVTAPPQHFLSSHYLPFCPFSILAQVSRSVTVRLNTSAPGRASRSTQK